MFLSQYKDHTADTIMQMSVNPNTRPNPLSKEFTPVVKTR